MSKYINKYILLTLFLLNFILFFKLKFFFPQLTNNARLQDFETYYRLVKDIISGINPYTVSYMQTLGPPTVFFYFLPFSVFNILSAQFLYTLINISCGFGACYLLSKKFFQKNKINWFLLLTLIFFSSFPARFSIEMGQPNLVVSYLVTRLICYPKTKSLNVILGFLIIIKTNYLMALTSLIRKNLGLVLKTILTILFIAVVLLPVIKPSYYSYYTLHKKQNIIPEIGKNKTLDYYNQSIPARLNVLGLGNAVIPLYLASATLILLILYKSQNLLLGIVASIILSPVSWQHYFAVLFPIFIIAFLKTKKLLNRMVLLTAFFFWWAEFPFLQFAKVNFFTALLSSHYLISATILFYIIYKKGWRLY